MKIRFTRKSGNRKTGPIPTTMSDRSTCPNTCPLKKNGCYADNHFVVGLWDRTATEGKPASELFKRVAALPVGQLWRHNVAGDLPHKRHKIDNIFLADLIKANHGKRGFTYTHHNLSLHHNRQSVKVANQAGFTINLSADNLEHADKLAELDIAPIVTLLPKTQTTNLKTPAGRLVVVCPAATSETVTCATCKLCARPDRRAIIGFPAHGTKNRIVSTLAEGS